ncbi:TRAP transporter substrate-binding protein [Aidingimonas halophila]|uniref:Tripartite ATP-independent transporter solute receptor, DctP family n=1 Tax=Aidingimonas halophila TaxID=574349 RepID=A0A1H3HU72_9GAMM|nr:DctP family TRAP transporter solute-binding subunit [Aidingimonas halophila]GHC38935.1 sialic acid-binding periplasmic protein SiaP [Aidingimonas halophila]SDY18338.1 tripartite ATP-independent transporter solute receptor, DctP family [Aidingimonas halophila]
MDQSQSMARMIGLTLVTSTLVGLSLNASAATSLRLAHTFNPGEASFELFEKLPDMIEERTGGDVSIQVFPSEQLGSEVELLEQASEGSVDIVIPGYSGASTLLAPMEISNAPFIFQSWDEAKHILEGDAYQPIFDELDQEYGLSPLSKTWYWGWRNLTVNGEEITHVSDMEDLKIRVPESPAWVEMINAFDASPTPIPFSEVYLALQQGTVDGQENPIPTIHARKFYEVQDNLIMTRHMLQSQVVLINSSSLNSLSSENQEILESTIQELSEENYAMQSNREEEMLNEMKSENLINVVDDIDRSSFEEAAQSAYSELTERWGEDHFNRISNAIEEYRSSN